MLQKQISKLSNYKKLLYTTATEESLQPRSYMLLD